MSTLFVEPKPLAEVTRDAIHVLCREIGSADTIRFVNQFSHGQGNYTEEREELFSGMSVDDIVSEMKKEFNLDTKN